MQIVESKNGFNVDIRESEYHKPGNISFREALLGVIGIRKKINGIRDTKKKF